MGRPEPRKTRAEGKSGARWWLADRAPAAFAAREPPPGGELRPAEGTRCEKTHRQGPIPCRMLWEPALSGECRLKSPGEGMDLYLTDVELDFQIKYRRSSEAEVKIRPASALYRRWPQ